MMNIDIYTQNNYFYQRSYGSCDEVYTHLFPVHLYCYCSSQAREVRHDQETQLLTLITSQRTLIISKPQYLRFLSIGVALLRKPA